MTATAAQEPTIDYPFPFPWGSSIRQLGGRYLSDWACYDVGLRHDVGLRPSHGPDLRTSRLGPCENGVGNLPPPAVKKHPDLIPCVRGTPLGAYPSHRRIASANRTDRGNGAPASGIHGEGACGTHSTHPSFMLPSPMKAGPGVAANDGDGNTKHALHRRQSLSVARSI